MKVICETYDSPKFGSLTLYMQENFPAPHLREQNNLNLPIYGSRFRVFKRVMTRTIKFKYEEVTGWITLQNGTI
jgi:hypothetical protein